MSDRKEPIVSDIQISADETPSRAGGKHTPAKGAGHSSTGTGLAVLALLAAAGLGALGYWQHQQLNALNAQLQQQSQALETLQQQLSATDEDANVSLAAVRATQKLHMSEIRKLWDVSNKRNKNDIASNSSSLKALSNDLKKQQTSAAQQYKKQNQAQDSLKQQLAALTTELKALQKAQGSSTLKQQVAQLQAAVNASELRGGQNNETLQMLESQLAQHSQQLRDQQVVITSLRQQVSALRPQIQP